MCPDDASAKVTSKTKGILPMHYAGIPAEMDRLSLLADRHGLLLVEDAAHAPGARYANRSCGTFGAAGCFSFFANKNMTTAEGGMITTSDPALACRLRSLRSHGMTVSSWDRDKGRPSHYDVLEFGFNFRFDDIRAALGLSQLEKLPQFNRKRAELAARYNARFLEVKADLILPSDGLPEAKESSHHIYPILLPNRQKRDAMGELLRTAGIQTSIHYPAIHQFTAFRQSGYTAHLPKTEEFAARELTLPLYPSLTSEQADAIACAVLENMTVISTGARP
jgi:dTDP-4-amino-4,6-dideoxygalactose transaminase